LARRSDASRCDAKLAAISARLHFNYLALAANASSICSCQRSRLALVLARIGFE
jgi:hypothetical protein